jgi:hypothetical protein
MEAMRNFALECIRDRTVKTTSLTELQRTYANAAAVAQFVDLSNKTCQIISLRKRRERGPLLSQKFGLYRFSVAGIRSHR